MALKFAVLPVILGRSDWTCQQFDDAVMNWKKDFAKYTFYGKEHVIGFWPGL